jgi:hypothetical protein
MRALRLVSVVGVIALFASPAFAQKVSLAPASPINMGAPPVNTTAMKDLVLTNASGQSLKINSISVPAAPFTLTGLPGLPLTIGPNVSLTICTINFTPVAQGNFSSSFSIVSTDPGSPTVVMLSGSAGNPMISLDTGTAAFGNERVGVPSMPQIVTITNTGMGDLNVTNLTLAGNNPMDFAINKMNAVGTINPGKSQTFSVTFTPVQLGNRSATVQVSSNAANMGVATVGLLGTGTQDMLAVAPGMLDFGSQQEYIASSPKSVMVMNTGNDAANITNVDFSGPQNMSFAVSGPKTGKVQVNVPFTVSVVAVPLQLGANMATMNIHYDDPNHMMDSVTLTVNGVGGKIAVSPNYVDFGNQEVNTTSMKTTVTVTNMGTAVLQILDFQLNDPMTGFGNMTPIMMGTMIMPNKSVPFDVEFTPTATMAYTASVDLTTDDPMAKLLRIPLAGVGTMSGVTITPANSLDFGQVQVGSLAGPKTVAINNTGGTQIQVQSIMLSSGMTSDFTVDQTGPFNVDPGKSQTLNVTFDPASTGARAATMQIMINGLPAVNYMLKGAGITPMLIVVPSTPIDFGMVPVGTPSDPQPVGLKNVGNLPIAIAGITSSDPSFQIDETGTLMNIPTGASGNTIFHVTFVPTTAAAHSGVISINVKGQTAALGTVNVTGMGVANTRPPVGGTKCAASPGAPTSGPLAMLLLLGGLGLMVAVPRVRRALRRR